MPHDLEGNEIPSDGEEHRHLCEARAVLAMRLDARRCYLDGYFDPEKKRQVRGVLQIRGQEECDRLKATIKKIWMLRRLNK